MLDPRLFDLLMALASSNLDWLAGEVVQGVLAGDVPLESEENVSSARSDVARRSQDQTTYKSMGGLIGDAPRLEGTAQLEWAIAHVSARLRDTLLVMSAASGRLDDLVEKLAAGEAQRSPGSARTQLVLVTSDETLSKAGMQEIVATQTGPANLERALKQWRDTSFLGFES